MITDSQWIAQNVQHTTEIITTTISHIRYQYDFKDVNLLVLLYI